MYVFTLCFCSTEVLPSTQTQEGREYKPLVFDVWGHTGKHMSKEVRMATECFLLYALHHSSPSLSSTHTQIKPCTAGWRERERESLCSPALRDVVQCFAAASCFKSLVLRGGVEYELTQLTPPHAFCLCVRRQITAALRCPPPPPRVAKHQDYSLDMEINRNLEPESALFVIWLRLHVRSRRTCMLFTNRRIV